MTQYRCLKCKGQVQASRLTYLSLTGTGFRPQPGRPDYRFYCDNDCWQYETGGVIDLSKPEDVLPDLVLLGFLEEGRPQ